MSIIRPAHFLAAALSLMSVAGAGCAVEDTGEEVSEAENQLASAPRLSLRCGCVGFEFVCEGYVDGGATILFDIAGGKQTVENQGGYFRFVPGGRGRLIVELPGSGRVSRPIIPRPCHGTPNPEP